MATYSDRNVVFKDVDNGNIGIGGTPEIGKRLHLTTASTNPAEIRFGAGAGVFDLGYVDIGSGKTFIAPAFTGASNEINIGFGAVTAGVPANNAVNILGSGNVGIGRTSSGGKLEIGGFTDPDTFFQFGTISDQAGMFVFDSSGSLGIQLLSSGNSFLNGGNVGIGTPTPSGPLEVNGNPTAGNFIGEFFSSNTGITNYHGLKVRVNLSTTTSNIAEFHNNVAAQMTIRSDGHVGIGTTSPNACLEIHDNLPQIRLGESADRFVEVQGQSNGPGDSADLVLFTTGSSGTSNRVMTLNGEHTSVGIGTASPPAGTRLTVQGPGTSASTNAFKVNNSTGGLRFNVQDNGLIRMNNGNWSNSSTQDIGMDTSSGEGSLVKFTSSRRYKDRIRPLEASTDWIYNLEPVNFRFVNDAPDAMASQSLGYIAEDVSMIAPSEYIFFDETHPDGPREESLHYKLFVVPIIEELKALRNRVVELEAINN